jgi:lysozyme
MPIDPQYLEAIKGFEGFQPKATWDHKQYSSGYGTKAEPGEVIDRATAEQRFQEAVQKAAAHVDSVNPNLPAGARAALISLTYNAGPGWSQSGLGELVKAGDLQGAQARLLEYNKASGQVNPGLVNRRAAEAAWFGSPAVQQPAQQVAPASPAAPVNAAPQRPAFFAPPQQSAPQQVGPSYTPEFPSGLLAQAPPLFAPPRKPPDLRALRAALARPSPAGLFFGKT